MATGEKEKLQATVTRGNLVDIAMREVLSGYFAKKRIEKVASLVSQFNGKSTATDMLPTIAAISALVEMENDLTGQVAHRDVAVKRIGELENESNAEVYREY